MPSRAEPALLTPEWPAPDGVRALFSLRDGGVSQGGYASMNLASHVGDDPAAVARNRARLAERCELPGAPLWLRQVHGTKIVLAPCGESEPEADAAVTTRPGQVLAVMVADCLPILLADSLGRGVAAVHAGWRGLAAGIVGASVAQLRELLPESATLLAWIGPGISQSAFQVGAEVRNCYVRQAPEESGYFKPDGARWRADLAGLARARLLRCGVDQVFGGRHCTWSDPRRFFSYRRSSPCGRMAALIWIEPQGGRGWVRGTLNRLASPGGV